MELKLNEIIGYLLALISILLTVYFRIRDKKKKRLSYILHNDVLVSNNSNEEKLKVYFKDELVKQFVKTEFILFNKASSTIEYSELGTIVGVQIEFSKTTSIYSVELIEGSSSNINFEFVIANNAIKLKFDYLKQNSFIHLKISTNEIAIEQIKLIGEFKEQGDIKRYFRSSFFVDDIKHFARTIFPFIILITIVAMLFSLKDLYVVLGGAVVGFIIPDFFDKIRPNPLRNKIKAFYN